MTFAVLLLAAGQSSRMQGRDKLLEPVKGEPLLKRQARAAMWAGAQVYVALPCPGTERHAALAGLPVTKVDVPDAEEGICASIRSGVAALRPGVSRLALLPADMPEIGTTEITAVLRAAEGDAVYRGSAEGSDIPGHPVVVPPRLFPALMSLTGDDGAKQALKGERIIEVPLTGDAAITDLDTPEAWEAWRAKTAR